MERIKNSRYIQLLEAENLSLRDRLNTAVSASQSLRRELEETTAAYSRILPPELLELLETSSILNLKPGTQVEREMTILFSDIRGFTTISEKLPPYRVFRLINSYLNQMEPLIFNHHGVIDKYIGDAIMAIFPRNADDALKASISMLKRLESFNRNLEDENFDPIQIGIGLNTGISMLGAVGGLRKMEETVISDAVNLAARLESLTKKYGVSLLISEHTLYTLDDAENNRIRFIDRVRVKGKSRPQCVFEVYDADPEHVRQAKLDTLDIFEEAVAHYHYQDVDKAEPLFEKCLAQSPSDRPAQFYLDRCRNYRRTGFHESTGELEIETIWKEEYNVGISDIDRQHVELLDQINKLSHAISAKATGAEISDALDFIEKYVQVHFKTEEALMEKRQYPFMEEHKKQHRVFYRYFLKLKGEMGQRDRNPAFLSFRTQIFLVDWLINHSTKTDKHLGKYLLAGD